jgi:hypothetical protein
LHPFTHTLRLVAVRIRRSCDDREGRNELMKKLLFVMAMAILAAGSASAQNALIDFQGYSYETGGFQPSNSGDVLSIVGVVDALDTRFGVNLGTEEVTVYVTGLVSGGEFPVGGGIVQVAYAGGTIEMYRDPSQDHDYGVNPPNATAPPTFVNGALFLGGALSSFFLYYDTTTGSGAYEANANFTSGSGLTTLNLLNASGYTFGGVISDATAGGTPPQGYDLQVDGVVEVRVPVAVQPQSWSGVKELYRSR